MPAQSVLPFEVDEPTITSLAEDRAGVVLPSAHVDAPHDRTPPAAALQRLSQPAGGFVDAPPLFMRHRFAKRYIIRVRDDGAVRVTLPRRGSLREAKAFVEAERHWIERERARIAARRQAAPSGPRASVVAEWRARAARELPQRLIALAARHNLSVARISVRNQRSRWGSCSPARHIALNWRLVMMPEWVRDYVMIHELMHLRRMDHSPTFWKLVAAACPEYRQARRWLADARRSASLAATDS